MKKYNGHYIGIGGIDISVGEYVRKTEMIADCNIS